MFIIVILCEFVFTVLRNGRSVNFCKQGSGSALELATEASDKYIFSCGLSV